MMNAEREHDRRAFLTMALAGVACAGCASASTSGIAPKAFGDVAAGKASDLRLGSIVAVAGAPACVARDAQGLYAMTVTCTHSGCDISSQGTIGASGLLCGCHGSEFDANGAVVNGPATQPLQHFELTIDAQGSLTIHGAVPVDAATRLRV
jgi:Rieske Fe-S protein